jgi:cell division protein FtsQ
MSPIISSQSRAEASRRRRNETSRTRSSHAREHVRNVASAPTLSRTRVTRPARTPARSKVRRRYQVAVPFVGSASMSLPSLRFDATPRTASGLLALAMAGLLALLWFVPPFIVGSAEIHGNNRLGASEINGTLGMAGRPLLMAMPAELAKNLRVAFPEIRDVSVKVGFPAQLIVTITERTPVVAWQQGDQVLWLDAEGVAFPPRGTADGLIAIQASGTPPFDALADPADPASAHRLLSPDAVTALQAITPYVPAGSALIYDPSYGLGWKDARGWNAYFGQTTGDISVKLQMYQTLVDNLAQRGIQPTMISVEFPNAPFYRVEQ